LTRQHTAFAELFLAAAIWGFGFVATIFALREYTAIEVNAWRFLIAWLCGEALYFFIRKKFNNTKNSPKNWRLDLKLALMGGLLLTGMFLPQTIGLNSTSAAKSSFITSLYVVLVPLFSVLLLNEKFLVIDFIIAGVALFGALALVEFNIQGVQPGDLWTLLCAVIATFHILYIGKVSSKISDPLRFNNFQSMVCLFATLPFLFFQEHIKIISHAPIAIFGLLFIALGSSVIAFTIQVRAQKVLSPTTASMLFLLESPFALFFGMLLLSEKLSLIQLFGALVILAASLWSVLRSHKSQR
jgi:drug/metabolite transporter (DMT)-like permease